METANKNPFLFDDTETFAQDESSFNPFVTTGEPQSVNNSFNPFLSATAEDNESKADTSNNPFASFFDIQSTAPTNKDEGNTLDVFGATNEVPVKNTAFDLLSDFTDNTFEAPKVETPQNFDLFQAGRRESQSDGNDSSKPPRPEPPRRPPPPKPNPPSRDTQDLILTVTGALEATSTDLLDRLQATRTPSPIPMKDLVSPSPTNFEEVHDLFNENVKKPDQVVRQPPPTPQEEYNVFEAIANLPKGDEIKQHVTALPSRPPPPPIPTKPDIIRPLVSPSAFDVSDTFDDSVFISSTPVEQPPLISPELKMTHTSTPIVQNLIEDDLISASMQQNDTIPTETKLSPETFKDKLGVGYIPSRKASHDVSSDRIQVIPSRKKYSLDYTYSQSLPKNTAGLTDNAILEIPKFSIMSTTPILSAEDVTDESIMDDKSEPNLIFDMQPSIAPPSPQETPQPTIAPVTDSIKQEDEFDEFSAKFDSFSTGLSMPKNDDPFDPFGSGTNAATTADEAGFASEVGFGNEDTFDDFLSLSAPPPVDDLTPQQQPLSDWGEATDGSHAAGRFNPFDKMPVQEPIDDGSFQLVFEPARTSRSESQETPQTPLFDEDVSQPLEPFPRTEYLGRGWEMQIRYPIRKKFTGQRFWKKVFVKLVIQGDTPHLEVINKDDNKETLLHEWPLQPCYAISDIGAQQYDQYGKIFTVKIQFVIYKERPGVRPGQVTKAERLSNKLSQFAAYAIQGDYQGVKEFGSDLKKLGLPVEHSPQMSLICKLGSHNYEDMKQFSACVEEALYRLPAHRDNIHINYKMEEVQITAVDELYVEQAVGGIVIKQIARVRLFFLGFLTGMPDVDLGVNDLRRQGKEVVGRHDIIPVVTEEWIRLENVEFHNCVQQDVYEETRMIRFKPPDACYLELMRFRVRPPKNRELPLQLQTTFRITGNKVDILSDILVPGFTSRKLGQIPCEDVVVRIPIPECWIYLFRVEKHFRYGSVKSAHRRTGKIKGIERLLGTVDTLEPHLIEVTSGHAKYEHHHRSIVWRMARLPKEGQGAYTTHNLICHLALTSYDQIPDTLAKYCYVEFTMPITQVSHTTVRSVSITNSDSDTPPEKYVRHLARHEYRVEIEHTHSDSANEYVISAAVSKPMPPPQPINNSRPPSVTHTESDTDSD